MIFIVSDLVLGIKSSMGKTASDVGGNCITNYLLISLQSYLSSTPRCSHWRARYFLVRLARETGICLCLKRL